MKLKDRVDLYFDLPYFFSVIIKNNQLNTEWEKIK